MTQQTILEEGAFQRTQRDQINENFTELYGAVTGGTGNIVTKSVKTGAAALAATGSTASNGAAIVSQVVNVTAADGTKAVVLPASTAGAIYFVYNSVATNGLPVFPTGTETINGGSAGAAVTIEGKTLAIFVCAAAGNWAAIFTANT